MSGSSSRVPLVRCPKCGHLLPKLPPYSVYCCGACGAYLRAEKGSRIEDTLSENSGDRTGEGSEKEMPAASNGVAKSVRSRDGGGAVRKSVVGESNLGDSDLHSKSSGRSVDGDGRKIPATESVGFKKSDEGRSMGSDDVVNYEEMEARKKVGAWFDNVNRDEWIGYDESAVNRARVSSGYGGRRGDHIIVDVIERDEAYVMRHEVPDSRHQDYGDGFRGNSQASSVRQRLPVYADEGPANYPSYYDYDRTGYSQEGLVGSSSLRNVEMNQAELYRLYHDLREKLTITGDLPVDSIRRGHHRVSSDGYVRDEPLRLRRPAASVDMDERARMSPHYMDRGRVPPSRFVPIEFSFDGDPSWSQIPGRAPPHRRHYPQRSSREYSAGHSVDSTYDRREGLHHPNCSCSLCHPRRTHEQAPAGVGYKRYPDSPIHTPPDFPIPHGLRASGTRFPYSISSRSRSSAETKLDEGSSTKEHKKRALVPNKNQLFYHPIAGAAPFVICYSCSQLLRLPKKLNAMKKTQVSLQCGSCRTVLSFDFSRKKSNVSTQLQPKPDPIDVYDEPIKTPEPDLKNAIDCSAGIITCESYDFDASVPSSEFEPSMHLDSRIPNPNEAEKKQELRPSSSNASRDDLGSGNAVKKTDAPSPLMSNIPPRPPPGSSLQERPSMFEIKVVLGMAILESEKRRGQSNSNLSMDDSQFLPPSESANETCMGKIVGESLSDTTEGHQSPTTECQSPRLGSPSNLKHHYSVQSPNERPPFSPPTKGDSLHRAGNPHDPAPDEYYRASPPYGSTTDVQLASKYVTHHPPTDATILENQGADYNEKRLSNRVLDLEKEVQGKKILFLFGEGCQFEKEMLIQVWMALDILNDEPMEGIGANYFEKLVSEGYILCSDANSLYKVNTEKLNIELDMITNKQNYVILDNGSRNEIASAETLHASVVCDEVDALIFKTLGGFNRLRTLLFLGNYGSKLQQLPRDLFLCYESLAALDLSGTHIKELPSSMGKMINLRYLDISWTYIEVLPERIDRFEKLQTLKLEGCSRLRRLPKEMKGLINLRHLHIDVLRQLTAFPEGMGALVNIRTLSAFPVGIEEGLKISELKYLNNIMGEFCIAKLENVQSADEAKDASLTAKRNIRKLKLRWSSYPLQEPTNEDESILKNLCPHADLEEIHILCYPGTNFPDWVADVSFHKLVSITLFRCVHVAMLPSLEKLPSLKYLDLISLNTVTFMDWKGEVGHVAFPKLQILAIDEMLNLQTWTEAQEGSYPSLVELSIKDCPNLLELPSLLYLPSIRHLELSGCTKLAFVPEKELSSSLQQLIVENCSSIEERCSKEAGQDWHKIQHIPTIWIDQMEIQAHEEV